MTKLQSWVQHGCLALLMAIPVGCASDPSEQSAANKPAMKDDPSKGIICAYEIPTGSVLRVKKCTTPEQREEQRRRAEQMVLEPTRTR